MPLHYVNPEKTNGRLYSAFVRFGRSRVGQAWAHHLSPRIDARLYRATGGRYPFWGMRFAPLQSTGAKSGQSREVQLTYFHDGDDVILIASNFGGSRHPGWFHNLLAHPECRFGGEPFTAKQVVDPDEYSTLFALAERVYAGYGDYRATTNALGRTIPLLRLTRR